MSKIKLHKIECITADESDKDEIYLKYFGKKVWPKRSKFTRVDSGDVAKVDIEIEVVSGWIELELWEFDLTSRNDHLGTFYLKVDDPSGLYTTDLERNDDVSERAEYKLNWEVM